MTKHLSDMVPRGSIRVSDAFEQVYRKTAPNWADLEELCVRWDEAESSGEDPPSDANPYETIDEAKDQAERLLRYALESGVLRGYVHYTKTGTDFELSKRGWWKFAERPGIYGDITGDLFPGPSCEVEGVAHPIFLDQAAFDRWLAGSTPASGAMPDAERVQQQDEKRMLSIDEAVKETGISRTRIYDAFRDRALRNVKYGRRTLIRRSDLDLFLEGLRSGS